MPRQSKSEKIQCRYYRWRIQQKKFDVLYADGRSGGVNLGRHSLGTKHRNEAIERLHVLDARTAVKQGVADRSILEAVHEDGLLSIADGAALYLKHVGRSRAAGGASKRTVQRYRAVLDKFRKFAEGEGVTCWRFVTKRVVENYSAHLDDEGYAYRTAYLELTLIK